MESEIGEEVAPSRLVEISELVATSVVETDSVTASEEIDSEVVDAEVVSTGVSSGVDEDEEITKVVLCSEV